MFTHVTPYRSKRLLTGKVPDKRYDAILCLHVLDGEKDIDVDALTAIASIGLPLLAGPSVALAALTVASEGLLVCHFSSCWDCTSPVRGPMGCQPRTRWARRI